MPRMRTLLWRKENTSYTVFCCCFQGMAGMFMSLTCSSERGDSGVRSFYTAGWKDDEGVKAFMLEWKCWKDFRDFLASPVKWKQVWALEPDGPS